MISLDVFIAMVHIQVINKGGVTYKNSPFHRECFVCNNCKKELAGLKFTSKEEQPYCAECYGDLFAKKCCRCTKPITGKWKVDLVL
jgi:LIM domain-containing protein 2